MATGPIKELTEKDHKQIKTALESLATSYERQINTKNLNDLVKETYRVMKRDLETTIAKFQ